MIKPPLNSNNWEEIYGPGGSRTNTRSEERRVGKEC
jgi:hypothetical protein